MNLSLGERPVNWPVRTTNEPPLARVAFAALDGVLQQLRRAQIPVRHIEVAEALLFETVTAGPDPRIRDLSCVRVGIGMILSQPGAPVS